MPEKLIRSVFDQYSHLENRLTNSLIQVLARDDQFTRDFIRFAKVPDPPKGPLSYSCQLVPGQRQKPINEEESPEMRSVPDAWIFCIGWTLLVEAKVESGLEAKQLRNHTQTARRQDFDEVHILTITADEYPPNSLLQVPDAKWLSWPLVYQFLADHASRNDSPRGFLAEQFLDYVRTVEARGEAKDKILSKFAGIRFGPDRPYKEGEARVVLRSLILELRPKLTSVLPTISDPVQKRRTGPWEILPFDFSQGEYFTNHPHISVEILENESSLSVVLPNAAKDEYWRRLRGVGAEQLGACLVSVLDRTGHFKRQVEYGLFEPRIFFQILHRHYQTPARYIVDGTLRFDIESRPAVLSRIRLSFVIAAPLVIFHGILTGYNATEWITIPVFAAVIAIVCGIMWAVSEARWSRPE